MSLTLHRLTGSREGATLYHHAGMGISYTDVRCLTNTWAKSISLSHKKILPPGFKKQRSVHVTFDNSDGKQQKLTPLTPLTILLVPSFKSDYAGEALDDDGELTSGQKEIPDKDNPKETDFRDYTIPKKRKSPKGFPEFTDNYSNSKLLEDSLYRDIAWVLVGHLGKSFLQEVDESISVDEIKDVGSWTAFMKDTTSAETMKCKLEYIPLVPFPPTDNIVKWYMAMIIQLAEDLKINHMFVHTDEAIHSKMLMIMWLHERKYEKILPLIGGFHAFLVYLKVLYKKYACFGLAQWWVDINAIKEGSISQAIEGCHY